MKFHTKEYLRIHKARRKPLNFLTLCISSWASCEILRPFTFNKKSKDQLSIFTVGEFSPDNNDLGSSKFNRTTMTQNYRLQLTAVIRNDHPFFPDTLYQQSEMP